MPRFVANTAAQIIGFADQSGGPTACWPWMKARAKYGYGVATWRSRKWAAHRLIWALTNGDIPDGKVVMHMCNNPPCCNPAHLRVATQAENIAHRDACGRTATGERSGAALHPEGRARGERHWTARRPDLIRRGAAHWSRVYPDKAPKSFPEVADERRARGERHGCARLTEMIVREVRSRASEDRGVLSESFGVSRCTINDIIAGRTWAHVK